MPLDIEPSPPRDPTSDALRPAPHGDDGLNARQLHDRTQERPSSDPSQYKSLPSRDRRAVLRDMAMEAQAMGLYE
jgi:hypothetical protein